MAIVVRGKSRCPICKNVIVEGEEIISFPSFVPNSLDPIAVFNDVAAHTRCVEKNAVALHARDRYEELLARVGPGHRVCVVCGNEIGDPDEYFTLGFLTEDEKSPLFRFNYAQLHRSCIARWGDVLEVIELLEEYKASGLWRGSSLIRLIEELKAHAW